MTTRKPSVDFAKLTDREIAHDGLALAQIVFLRNVGVGYTNGDSMAAVVGVSHRRGNWAEWDRSEFGPDGEQFFANISPGDGKLATALEFCMSSADANDLYGANIPEGPQRFTGGVYFLARVNTERRGSKEQVFVGAASGVQGLFDQSTIVVALYHMATLWALREQALHGQP